jgi:hypothetical protein
MEGSGTFCASFFYIFLEKALFPLMCRALIRSSGKDQIFYVKQVGHLSYFL